MFHKLSVFASIVNDERPRYPGAFMEVVVVALATNQVARWSCLYRRSRLT